MKISIAGSDNFRSSMYRTQRICFMCKICLQPPYYLREQLSKNSALV
jgi:hypothetical protein